jgi:hypothetical protein
VGAHREVGAGSHCDDGASQGVAKQCSDGRLSADAAWWLASPLRVPEPSGVFECPWLRRGQAPGRVAASAWFFEPCRPRAGQVARWRGPAPRSSQGSSRRLGAA